MLLYLSILFLFSDSLGIPYNGVSMGSGSLFGSSANSLFGAFTGGSSSSGGSSHSGSGMVMNGGMMNGGASGMNSGGMNSGMMNGGNNGGMNNGVSSGNTELKCTPFFETVYEDKCQSYMERVCTTQHQENCFDVPGENCKAILASKQVRKCFNVTELLCSLKEDVEYEVIQATVTVQNCHKVNERVCDTVYKTQFTNKDDYKCIELANVACVPHDKVIQDKTCKTTTEFDCKEVSSDGSIMSGFDSSNGDSIMTNDGSMMGSNGMSSNGMSSMGSNGMGSNGIMGSNGMSSNGMNSMSSNGMIGSNGMSSMGSNGAYGSNGGYSPSYKPPYPPKTPSYGYEEPPKVVCKKSVSNKCYNTPRTVGSEKCEMRKEKKCEKFAERTPFPVEKQHCHNDEKRVCELETRTQPKQVKKYVYSKQCRPMRRTICENADVKDLVQSCAPYTHKSCSYTPKEKCVEVPKEHCYKVGKKVQKQKCETVYSEAGYGSNGGGNSMGGSMSGGNSMGGSMSGGSGSMSGGNSMGGSMSGGSSMGGHDSSSSDGIDFSSADSYGVGDFGSTFSGSSDSQSSGY